MPTPCGSCQRLYYRPSTTDHGFAWLVLCASFLLQFLIDGVLSAYGTCLPAISAEYNNKTVSQLSLPNSIQSGMFLLGGPVAAALVNRWGMMAVASLGSVLSCSSIFISSVITNFSAFVVVFGFLCGLGFSFMIIPAIVGVNLFFSRFRPFANGLSSAGAGLGYILMPMTLKLLLNTMAWRDAIKVIGGITSTALLASFLLWPFIQEMTMIEAEEKTDFLQTASHQTPQITLSPPEDDLGANRFHSMPTIAAAGKVQRVSFSSQGGINAVQNTQVVLPLSRSDIFYSGFIYDTQVDKIEAHAAKSESKAPSCAGEVINDNSLRSCFKDFLKTFDFALFLEPDFVLIVLVSTLTQFAYFVPFVYLYDYASQMRGIPDHQIVWLAVALGAANTVGRVTGGLLANIKRIDPLLLSAVSLSLCAASSLCVPFFSTFPQLMAYSSVQGFALAVTCSIQPILLINATNLFRFTAGVGNMNMVKGIASFIGTPIAGALVDTTGNYNAVFFWAGGCFVSALLSLVPLAIFNHRKKKKSTSKDTLSSTVAI